MKAAAQTPADQHQHWTVATTDVAATCVGTLQLLMHTEAQPLSSRTRQRSTFTPWPGKRRPSGSSTSLTAQGPWQESACLNNLQFVRACRSWRLQQQASQWRDGGRDHSEVYTQVKQVEHRLIELYLHRHHRN